jgi:ADP-heptose:LPS heptosyltransferase
MSMALANRSPAADRVGDRDRIDRMLGPVRSIVVFRALVLGDMICATPALRALRLRFPQAHITLVGLPWAQEWAARQPCIDDFMAFPGHPSLPEGKVTPGAWPDFIAYMRAKSFDLAVQLHGSGGISNGIVSQLGARHVAAFHEPGVEAPEPALGALWPRQGRETERLLVLVDALGRPAPVPQPANRLALDFPLTPVERTQAAGLLAEHGLPGGRAYVCLHPGSQLPSRRWPVERFAEVADALAERGHAIVITGIQSEALLAAALQGAMKKAAVNLVGQTTLWELGAVIEGARLLVCNDTGVSHVAAALGTPSVVVSSGADVSRWAPADELRHAVLWSDQPCRPCAHAVCPYAHECAVGVSAGAVIRRAMAMLTYAG